VNPVIFLCYWHKQEGKQFEIGEMIGYACALHNYTLEANYEIVY